jgi:hypothetical protein
VDAAGFIEFVKRLRGLDLKDERQRPLTASSVVDHVQALSIYFSDPYRHRLEVTTYDRDAALKGLA